MTHLDKTLDYSVEDFQNYRTLIDAAREIILKFDINGKITFVNQGAQDISGYIEEEMLGMNIADILPPNYLEGLKETLFGKNLSEHAKVNLYEAEFINRELQLIPIEINASAILSNGKPSDILFIARDITDRKKREIEQAKAVKFELIDRFSRGIARNSSRLLNEIINEVDFAHINSVPESTIYRRLSDAQKLCKDLQEFIENIASFSNPGKLMREVSVISELLNKSFKSAFKQSHILCKFSIQKDLWAASFDTSEMEHVFYNIAINAAEAMPSGGKININAENIVLKDSDYENILIPSGEYVKISVRDYGEGIPEKYINKVFDPYFSTKKTRTDQVRGLGLTHVYSIVKKHRGYVNISSKPGIRTVVSIFLPALSKEKIQTEITSVEEDSPENENRKSLIMGKILLMDDEEIVRDVAGQMLYELGYIVVYAREGTEAVNLYKAAIKDRQPFDAVILDLNVKEGSGGKAAIMELAEIDPDVKGIASSGYSNDPEMKDYKYHGFSGVVGKPYSIWELEETLEKIMTD
ncbi:PAS domain S-box protein [Desulfobacterales bacterium HSG17]|nr:PAS domain S-box protein [Desulfobacterales bacterium HSG17]